MAKKAKKASKASTVSKADFIRSQSTDMPVSEVVAKGAAKGLKFSPQYVYTVRAKAATVRVVLPRGNPGTPKTETMLEVAKRNGVPVVSAGPGPAKAKLSAENLLRACVTELGATRALDIIEEQRAELRAVIG